MNITNRNTENLFSVFSLRGRCLRERRPDVVHLLLFTCAPLLTGVTLAVVLGLMFALSTPVFALGGGGGGGSATAPKVTKVADPVAKSKDEVAEVENPVVGPREKATVEPDERTAELPKPGDRLAKTGDEIVEVGGPATEPEDKPPAVSELTGKGHEERTLAIKDPVGKVDTKSEDEIDAEAGGEINDEPGTLGDETVEGGDDDTTDMGYVRADIGFTTSTSNVEEGDTLDLRIRITRVLPRPVTVELSLLFGDLPSVDIGNIPDSLTKVYNLRREKQLRI